MVPSGVVVVVTLVTTHVSPVPCVVSNSTVRPTTTSDGTATSELRVYVTSFMSAPRTTITFPGSSRTTTPFRWSAVAKVAMDVRANAKNVVRNFMIFQPPCYTPVCWDGCVPRKYEQVPYHHQGGARAANGRKSGSTRRGQQRLLDEAQHHRPQVLDLEGIDHAVEGL